jgi:hypothetical protein
MDRAGLGLFKNIPYRKIRNYLEKSKRYNSIDDFLVAIGEGSLSPLDFVSELYPQKSATLGAIKWFEMPILRRNQPAFTPVSIKIVSKDAVEQLSRILKVVGSFNVNVLKTKAYISIWTGDFILRQVLAIQDFSVVSKLFENLEQIDGIKKIERLFWQRKLLFAAGVTASFCLWLVHPIILNYLVNNVPVSGGMILATPFLYLGLFVLFMIVFLLKDLTQRSFPELRETSFFWLLTYVLTAFAAVTAIAEIYYFNLHFNLLIVGTVILFIFAYLTTEYWRYRLRMKG